MNKWSYEDIMPRSACSIGAYVRRCTPPVENRTRSSCFMDASRAGVNQWLSESANSAQSEFTAQASLCGLLSKSQYLMPLIAFSGSQFRNHFKRVFTDINPQGYTEFLCKFLAQKELCSHVFAMIDEICVWSVECEHNHFA